MKLFNLVVAVSLLVAAEAATFQLGDCILMDVEANLTVTATKGKETFTLDVNLAEQTHEVTGNCSAANATSNGMTVAYTVNNATLNWSLVFSVGKDDTVSLEQNVSFKPSEVFGNTTLPTDFVSLTDAKKMKLSGRNASYECDAQTTIPFKPVTKDFKFTITQVMRNLRVQAFDLVKNNFSDAVHCKQDQTTVSPTTEPPTTAPATTPPVTDAPVATFTLKDNKNVVCFRLEAGLQFTVEYNTTNNTMAMSKVMTIPSGASVGGTCANGTDMALMTISGADYELEINETMSDGQATSSVKLHVRLDKDNFPNADLDNQTVTFEGANLLFQSTNDTYFRCLSEQNITFAGSRTTMFTNNLLIQAFGLKNGTYTGDGVQCGADPSPSPPPTPAPTSENKYYVYDGNRTCIVLQADISFSNITYLMTNNKTAVGKPITIPKMNTTSHNVNFTGHCDLEGGRTQQLEITFNDNWHLTMNFTSESSSKASLMLSDTQNEFYLRDIQLVYFLQPDIFPNATDQSKSRTVSSMNMTNELWKGAAGGSYRCDADITQNIGNGVVMETKNLQYKAFNKNNDFNFDSDNVSQCPSDDESNSVVPIAVGAALAGLVVIVLIAYLIGRRRSRREGYESV